MDSWKPKPTIKERICMTLIRVIQILVMLAIMEAMTIMFFLMS